MREFSAWNEAAEGREGRVVNAILRAMVRAPILPRSTWGSFPRPGKAWVRAGVGLPSLAGRGET